MTASFMNKLCAVCLDFSDLVIMFSKAPRTRKVYVMEKNKWH